MAEATKHHQTRFTQTSDVELVATRVVDAPIETVWAMHTDPKHLPNWLLGPEGWSMPVCEVDLRSGGKWHYVWRGPGDDKLEMHGEYREVVPPKRLVNTEEWGGEWPQTLNTLELSEEDGRTTIKTTVVYQSKQALEAAIGTGMKEGWAYSYERLDDYLGSLR